MSGKKLTPIRTYKAGGKAVIRHKCECGKEEIKMKTRTTRKAIVNSFENLVSVGYCDLQTLLRNHAPIAYTSGVYGWNFDVYEVYGLTICTGCRGMPGRTASNVREYESRARSILNEPGGNWADKDEQVENLLREFCAQA